MACRLFWGLRLAKHRHSPLRFLLCHGTHGHLHLHLHQAVVPCQRHQACARAHWERPRPLCYYFKSFKSY